MQRTLSEHNRGIGGSARAGVFLTYLVWSLLAVGTMLLLYARFNNVNGVVEPFLQRSAEPSLYAGDLYVTHSIVPRSTLLFGWAEAFRFDLTQPAFVIAAYLLTTAVAGWAVWRTLGIVFDIRDLALRAVLLFAMIFADFKLLEFHKSSWMVEHNFSFTFIATAFRCWFVFFALSGRNIAMCAVLLPINILTFKIGWPLTGFAVLLLLWQRERSLAAWALLLLSLVPPLLAALAAPGLSQPSEARALFDILIGLHTAEDAPFAGAKIGLPLFVAGTALACAAAFRMTPALRDRICVILFASLAIFLLGGLYLSLGGPILPLPVVVLLSPARALETATYLIYMIALVWIVRTTALDNFEKAILLLAAMTLKITPDGKWVALPLALAIFVVALRISRIFFGAWIDRLLPVRLNDVALPIALLAPLLGAFFAFNVSGQRTTYAYDPVLGFHDSSIPADALTMLRDIAESPADRRILFMQRRGSGWAPAKWNQIVRKSGVDADPYYLPTLDLMNQQARLDALGDQAAAEIAGGAIGPATRQALRTSRTTLVVPKQAAAAAPGWTQRRDHGAWVELEP